MVKINKSQLPDGVKITSEKSYQSDPVFSLIKSDCNNKCYICEEKEPSGLNVEHRVAHQGNKALKYDWNNLLLSCYHCNHAKGSKFNNILDCTVVDPEEFLEVLMMPYPNEYVSVRTLRDTDEAKETAQLLDIVYNGEKTAILNAECENLRNRVMKELVSFQQKLIEYFEENDSEIKQGFWRLIVKMIARNSNFASLKRIVIRRNSDYMREFSEYLA
ncbi:MAG: HNH endonuclease [Clostridiales bacterium]|nr:HNH endonuclease [Clostridiales bacterium]